MNAQHTLESMQRLKLSGMAKSYEAVLSQPIHEQPESHLLMALTIDAEKGQNAQKNPTPAEELQAPISLPSGAKFLGSVL